MDEVFTCGLTNGKSVEDRLEVTAFGQAHQNVKHIMENEHHSSLHLSKMTKMTPKVIESKSCFCVGVLMFQKPFFHPGWQDSDYDDDSCASVGGSKESSLSKLLSKQVVAEVFLNIVYICLHMFMLLDQDKISGLYSSTHRIVLGEKHETVISETLSHPCAF